MNDFEVLRSAISTHLNAVTTLSILEIDSNSKLSPEFEVREFEGLRLG